MNFASILVIAASALLILPSALPAATVPAILNYQGRLLVGTTAFDGTGRFAFSLVDATGTQVFWRNAPDANQDGRPDATVPLVVSRGLYSVLLGDVTLPNMAPLPTDQFPLGDVYLRVWFDDGTHGPELLAPDQRLASVSYALVAGSVPDASISAEKLAPGALQAAQLSGTLTAAQVPALDATKLTSGVLDPARLPAGLARKDPDLTDLDRQLQGRLDELARWIAAVDARVGGLTLTPASRPGAVLASPDAHDSALEAEGFVPFATLPAADWVAGSQVQDPHVRASHGAAWIPTGAQWLIWGGETGAGSYSAAGAIYQPSTDTWQPISTFEAPLARRGHSLTSDGAGSVYVWGGFTADGFTATGARYDLANSAWTELPLTDAPSARDGHVAVLVDSKLFVWGGRSAAGLVGDLHAFNTLTRTWSVPPLNTGPSPRVEATAILGDTDWIVWGGVGDTGALGTGARLRFQSGVGGRVPTAWLPCSEVNAPAPRSGHTAVWTGTRLLIWGGRNGEAFFGDGSMYDPVADTWTALPTEGAPTPRSGQVAVWTGKEMLIFAGANGIGELADGAAYNPTTQRWRPLSSGGSPLARTAATAVWSGTELLVFGGRSGGQAVGSLQRLAPEPAWHLYRKLQP